MGKSKKPKRQQNARRDAPQSIRFELEENAHQLLLEHLDRVKPEKEVADSPEAGKRARSRTADKVVRSIDLHGFRLEEACAFLEAKIEAWLMECSVLKLRVITGKGRHSQGGSGVLAREIHRFVMQRYGPRIQDIELSPDAVRLENMPLRGHFHVTLRGRGSSS